MIAHTCKICGKEKDVTEFCKHLKEGPYEIWNLRQCKSCTHDEYVKRKANEGSYESLKTSSRKWKANNLERHAELARQYRKRHPEQIIAQNRLNYAIKKGRITRLPCQICGTVKNVHAHHESYKQEDWYNVKWLCYICHKKEHHK